MLLRSLGYREFRLFFIGQFISLCGTWMQQTAQAWLIYRLTGDPFMLGLAAMAGQFPVFVLGFYAGTRVDRVDRLKLVRWMQFAMMLQAAALAALAYSGHIRVWHVFVLAALLGSLNAFDIPARQVLIGELVEPSVRHNALALNSAIVNGSRVLGPAAAGVLIVKVGEAGCFLVNALSFVAVLTCLWLIKPRRQAAPGPEKDLLQDVREGLGYVAGDLAIRRSLILLAVFTLFGMSLYVLMPVIADGILGAGARGLGWLSSASGVGATIGALFLAGRATTRGFSRLIPAAACLFGLALFGVAFSRSIAVSSLLFVVAGFSLITVLAASNTLLQELSADRYRGRVMSYYAMIFVGIAPLGSFAVGALAARLGAARTVAAVAAALAAFGAVQTRRLPESVGPKTHGAPGPEGPDVPAGAPL